MCMIVGLWAPSQCINHFRRCGFFCFKHYFGQVDDLFFVSFINAAICWRTWNWAYSRIHRCVENEEELAWLCLWGSVDLYFWRGQAQLVTRSTLPEFWTWNLTSLVLCFQRELASVNNKGQTQEKCTMHKTSTTPNWSLLRITSLYNIQRNAVRKHTAHHGPSHAYPQSCRQ